MFCPYDASDIFTSLYEDVSLCELCGVHIFAAVTKVKNILFLLQRERQSRRPIKGSNNNNCVCFQVSSYFSLASQNRRYVRKGRNSRHWSQKTFRIGILVDHATPCGTDVGDWSGVFGKEIPVLPRDIPVNIEPWQGVVTMLGQRLRRCPSIVTASCFSLDPGIV